MHAGEQETSEMLIVRPDLVHLDRADQESGADQARLKLPDNLYTAIWWYASFPFHYSGDGAAATRELGEYDMDAWTAAVEKAIRVVKADKESLRLQNEFFEKGEASAGHSALRLPYGDDSRCGEGERFFCHHGLHCAEQRAARALHSHLNQETN